MSKEIYIFFTSWFGSAFMVVILFGETSWDGVRILQHTAGVLAFMFGYYASGLVWKALKERDK